MSSLSDQVPSIVATLVGLAAAGGGLYPTVKAALGSYKRDVAENRRRLQHELQISTAGVTIPGPQADDVSEDSTGAEGSATTQHNTYYNIRVDQAATAEELRAEREEKTFSLLLADYYAHGLTQAQRSSIMSLIFSGLGCAILFVGVALAIWHSDTTGDLYAAVSTNVTGIVTGTVGMLFHKQARGAMEHLASQTKLLRQDMRSERGTRNAIRLVNEVDDLALRGRLQAALILKFADATLPDAVGEYTDPTVPAQHPNGGRTAP
ncbi:hypothetical protein A6P39_015510 [Streptomyces sp. FXJ1.172]|uniref:TRADD-N-associated membrane domain-containing protein n=1 Tax=Streptomyces sp. FXJ1.172 TaxID=710705 RepID=UPI0013319417|nr:hypothetical protein [Streptomyces sp. FXJ1.172]WEO95319.1 hypothetical protein A6P39_015510 [Streptomyces sp. FXJ1.172]